MKTTILITAITLSSCSALYHVEKANKHVQKAVKIDPSITVGGETKTVHTVTHKIDTLIEIDTVDNYIVKTITIRDTVFKTKLQTTYKEYDFSKVKSKVQARQEERTNRVEARQETKQVKSNDKKEVKIEKSKNRVLLWVIIGLLFGAVIGWVLRDLVSKEQRRNEQLNHE